MTEKEKASKLLENAKGIIQNDEQNYKHAWIANAICDEVMSAVVTHGDKWHFYSGVKNEIEKL